MHLQGVHWRPRKCCAEIVISKQITGLEILIAELELENLFITQIKNNLYTR